ncbi:MAG: SBBP repeat-containing protein, partial [Gemmataceae bacterium]|nr:SBBP repeat-containing protein [Gemmataceae bacterium]
IRGLLRRWGQTARPRRRTPPRTLPAVEALERRETTNLLWHPLALTGDLGWNTPLAGDPLAATATEGGRIDRPGDGILNRERPALTDSASPETQRAPQATESEETHSPVAVATPEPEFVTPFGDPFADPLTGTRPSPGQPPLASLDVSALSGGGGGGGSAAPGGGASGSGGGGGGGTAAAPVSPTANVGDMTAPRPAAGQAAPAPAPAGGTGGITPAAPDMAVATVGSGSTSVPVPGAVAAPQAILDADAPVAKGTPTPAVAPPSVQAPALPTPAAATGIPDAPTVPSAQPAPTEADPGQPTAAQRLARSSVRFEANAGQTDERVAFLARGAGYQLFLTHQAEAVLVLPGERGSNTATALRIAPVGGNSAPAVEGLEEQAGKSNYFRGSDPSRWHTDVANYGRVEYRDVYPGIDLQYYGNAEGRLEYDFVVAPGSDPSVVALAVEGADSLELDGGGDLLIHTATGTLRQHAPVVYQEGAAGRETVAAGFALRGGEVGFNLGAYDRTKPLVIDPVLGYSTYFGGSSEDGGQAITVDAAGYIYLVGQTGSTNFPATTGAYDTSLNGWTDAFIAKFTPAGVLAYATYLGGVGEEGQTFPFAVAADSSGNAYVTGTAQYETFPTTEDAYQTTLQGNHDIFVTKLNSSGSALVYSTLLGGNESENEEGWGIAVNASGQAYVAGLTDATDYPTTTGVAQETSGGSWDAVVTKLNADGTDLVFSTYLGGETVDQAYGIALDGSGYVYVTGVTDSSDFPTANADQGTKAGNALTTDAFVTKLSPSGSSLSYSTYLGGTSGDAGYGVALDGSGNAYVTGVTGSTDFPDTAGAYQGSLAGGGDAFVAKYSSSGSRSYASYFGGTGNEGGNVIAVTAAGEAVIAGTTDSTNLPTVNAAQVASGGNSDAFVARLNSTGTALLQATYWGSSSSDYGNGLALDGTGTAYLAGTTGSTDFPISSNAQQTSYAGGFDAFVTKLGVFAQPPAFAPGAGAVSAAGVRYADGAVFWTETDLGSGGFGMPWGRGRTWSSAAGYSAGSANGSGVQASGLPFLLASNGTDTIAAVMGGTDTRFFDEDNGDYVARFFLWDRLTYDTNNDEFVLTEPDGGQWRFFDFANSLPVNQRGQLKSYTDPYGNLTEVTDWDDDGRTLEVQRVEGTGGSAVTESFLYDYLASGAAAGMLESVTLRRKVGTGSWETARKVEYDYYGVAEDHGNPGNLKTATLLDPVDNVLDTSYYRYYQPGEANGYAGGLKYVFSPPSFARLDADVGDPFTASDSTIAPYADRSFKFDSQRRVTEAVVQGAGAACGGTGDGLGTSTYSYTNSSFTSGPNSWKTKTVETLPDGNQFIVYTNAAGQTMLEVFRDVVSEDEWITYRRYDSEGHLILSADPSAISGYDDTKADLLDNQSGDYQYLRDSEGLITIREYYSSTTATGTTAGGVEGALQRIRIQRGEFSTVITLSSRDYYARSVGSDTIVTVANETSYANTDGSGGRTTSYSYTWHGNTAQIESVTATLPTISTSENGSGTAVTEVSFFDSRRRQLWFKDGDGFLDYTEYDFKTGAVVKTITDVDTTQTGSFFGLPTGWTTPSGGGLHLVTQMEVDRQGRTTKLTRPGGDVTYTVYNDTIDEVRTYAGWNSTTGRPTGPTVVERYDKARGYYEALTMSAAPNVANGEPTGTEAISGVLTLSRSYVNKADQVTHEDNYFDLTGVTYSTAANLGTENTNYYRTRYCYDGVGRLVRVLSPTGTIYRTVYDALDRVVSEWVGTNDTPASGQWSPSNNNGSANMVKVEEYTYDGGGVGDGNLTQSVAFPGGGAANRTTQFYYDWRNRLVAQKDGVEGTESTSVNRTILYWVYNNLDETTEVRQYDGDGVSITIGTDGVPVAPSASLLRAKTTTAYDAQGRVYRTQVYSVDPSSGSVSSSALTTDLWYGKRGQLIKTAFPGGLVEKAQYDGAGRLIKQFTTDGGGDSSWADAGTVTGDQVLSQVETGYDANGNPIFETTRQRFHDETGTGELGTPTSGVKARVSYTGTYYDAIDRVTAEVDVGTNVGAAWARLSTPPDRSDTVLVVSYTYNDAGWLDSETNPRGIVSKIYYDALGREIKTIEAYTDGTPTDTTNKTTEFTYNAEGEVLTVKAVLPGGNYQTTQFVYGVTTAAGSDINSNDLLAEVRWPDKSTGAPARPRRTCTPSTPWATRKPSPTATAPCVRSATTCWGGKRPMQ